MSFNGFDPNAVSLLDDLPAMTADDYAAHKAVLSAGVVKPGGALIVDVAAQLDADLTVVLRSSVSPLHRDLRFAPEGAARYKDHLLLTTWEGDDKKTSPMFWIRIDARQAGFASGIGFTPDVRERWRASVGGTAGESLSAELDRVVAERSADVAGDQVKNVPAPFDADHPRAELLRHTGFQVRFTDDLPDVSSPDFSGWCADRLAELMPVHRWLVTHLTNRSKG